MDPIKVQTSLRGGQGQGKADRPAFLFARTPPSNVHKLSTFTIRYRAMKQPAFQFYPGDWLKDPAVSLCSPAARGIWWDLICAMHESDRSGTLSGTPDQLARIARCSAEEFLKNVREIGLTGAADVTEHNGIVTVTNRRMKREAKSRNQAKKRQETRREKATDNAPVTPLSRQSHTGSSSSSSDPLLISPQKNAPPDEDRAMLFRAALPVLYAAFGIDQPSWRDEEAMHAAWTELRAKKATSTELTQRITRYRELWPDLPCTANAVLKHWHTLKPAPKPQAVAVDEGTPDSLLEDGDD